MVRQAKSFCIALVEQKRDPEKAPVNAGYTPSFLL